MVPDATTTTGSAASTATLAMSAAAHSFHVHSFAVVLFLLGWGDVLGDISRPPGSPRPILIHRLEDDSWRFRQSRPTLAEPVYHSTPVTTPPYTSNPIAPNVFFRNFRTSAR
jgi:hypothetical protein